VPPTYLIVSSNTKRCAYSLTHGGCVQKPQSTTSILQFSLFWAVSTIDRTPFRPVTFSMYCRYCNRGHPLFRFPCNGMYRAYVSGMLVKFLRRLCPNFRNCLFISPALSPVLTEFVWIMLLVFSNQFHPRVGWLVLVRFTAYVSRFDGQAFCPLTTSRYRSGFALYLDVVSRAYVIHCLFIN